MTDSSVYTQEQKIKLADKIHGLKEINASTAEKKSYYKEILNIIKTHNDEFHCTKKKYSLLTEFQNYANITYIKLDEYVSNIMNEQNEQQKIDDSIYNNSQSQIILTNNSEDTFKRKNVFTKKLRLTNTETHILNRVRYEKELKKNQTNESEDANENYSITDTIVDSNKNTSKYKKPKITKNILDSNNSNGEKTNIFITVDNNSGNNSGKKSNKKKSNCDK
jgi:hypothetical protein